MTIFVSSSSISRKSLFSASFFFPLWVNNEFLFYLLFLGIQLRARLVSSGSHPTKKNWKTTRFVSNSLVSPIRNTRLVPYYRSQLVTWRLIDGVGLPCRLHSGTITYRHWNVWLAVKATPWTRPTSRLTIPDSVQVNSIRRWIKCWTWNRKRHIGCVTCKWIKASRNRSRNLLLCSGFKERARNRDGWDAIVENYFDQSCWQ